MDISDKWLKNNLKFKVIESISGENQARFIKIHKLQNPTGQILYAHQFGNGPISDPYWFTFEKAIYYTVRTYLNNYDLIKEKYLLDLLES